jgi:glycosyltransferase involved in cell wall biosynthesis
MCLIRWRRPPQIWRARGRRVLEFPEGFKILCPSEFMAERLRTDGIRVRRVLRGFVPDPGPGDGGTSPRSETIVFVGILERRKGPHTLLHAFIKSKVDQGFKLAIVGEGPLKGELRARVQSEGVQNRVSVPGFLASQDLRALMSQAALMVVPSEWPENAPSTALEAFSYGVPVLGTREGGLPEILTPESGSMLFDSGNVDELSGLLVSLWNDRKALLAKGRMARRVYEERFGPVAHVTEYMSVLKD